MSSTQAGADPGATAPGAALTRWLKTPLIRDPRTLSRFQQRFSEFMGGIMVEPLYGQPMAVAGSLTSVDDMVISIGRTTPTRCVHPAARGLDDTLILMGAAQGDCEMAGRGTSLTLAAGDVLLDSAARARAFLAHTPARLCMVTLNRRRLQAMGVDVDAALLRPVRANPATQLLMNYAAWVRDQGPLASPELRSATTLHMHDLAALVAGGAREVAQLAQRRGGRAARLLGVKQDIQAHCADAALTVGDVARRQRMSTRYLQMLLEDEGSSFTALVLEYRLTLAHRLLCDPRLAPCGISGIALDAGFGDLSYFNRCFRRRYGQTPSDVRAQARAR